MAAKVKCQACGMSINRDTAFKVSKNKVNKYYCTEREYLHKIHVDAQKKIIKNDTYNKINDIFGRVVTNTILFSFISSLASVYSYEKIRSYLYYNDKKLERDMNKTFQSEYAQIKYFCTILGNHLEDYVPVEEEIYITDNEYEIEEIKYKAKKKRRSLDDLEMGLLDG